MKQKAEKAPRKKGVNGRKKGISFEWECACAMVEAFGAPFTRKHCHRTRGSGGDRYLKGCDTTFHPSLQAAGMDLGTEMKFEKKFYLRHFFQTEGLTQLVIDYHRQVLKACTGEFAHLRPTLVLRGPDRVTLVSMRRADFLAWSGSYPSHQLQPFFCYEFEGVTWLAFLWEPFLEIIRQKGESYRADTQLAAAV